MSDIITSRAADLLRRVFSRLRPASREHGESEHAGDPASSTAIVLPGTLPPRATQTHVAVEDRIGDQAEVAEWEIAKMWPEEMAAWLIEQQRTIQETY